MKTLVDLIFHKTGYIPEEDRDSDWKEDLTESEKSLTNTLSYEQKKLFQSYKCCFTNHIQSVYDEDFELYTYYALKIGQEYQEFFDNLQ